MKAKCREETICFSYYNTTVCVWEKSSALFAVSVGHHLGFATFVYGCILNKYIYTQ